MAVRTIVGGRVFWLETCYSCKVEFMMADHTHAVAMEKREKFNFCCPYGHEQHYVSGESELDKLRRERDRLKQNEAWYNDALKDAREARDLAERRRAAAKGQITRLKKRAAAGVCPCCNRTFSDLARHMAGKHPEFVLQPSADEHVH